LGAQLSYAQELQFAKSECPRATKRRFTYGITRDRSACRSGSTPIKTRAPQTTVLEFIRPSKQGCFCRAIGPGSSAPGCPHEWLSSKGLNARNGSTAIARGLNGPVKAARGFRTAPLKPRAHAFCPATRPGGNRPCTRWCRNRHIRKRPPSIVAQLPPDWTISPPVGGPPRRNQQNRPPRCCGQPASRRCFIGAITAKTFARPMWPPALWRALSIPVPAWTDEDRIGPATPSAGIVAVLRETRILRRPCSTARPTCSFECVSRPPPRAAIPISGPHLVVEIRF